MRISLIAAFYKDVAALQLIIDSLRRQNYNDFELIVAEDNNDPAISEYLKTINDIDVIHTFQEDIGIRKSRSLNNAIQASTGEYLIFIDGDCIPYSDFVATHAQLAEQGCVLIGRRVNLGPRISNWIRNGRLNVKFLEKFFILLIPILVADGASHIGQGLRLSRKSLFYTKYFSKRKKSNTNILGCNFSCFKADMLNIDGFDESYGGAAIPDDTDLQWRFQAYGLKMKSCKRAANVFHLYHKHIVRLTPEQGVKLRAKMQARKQVGNYQAEIGISTHTQ